MGLKNSYLFLYLNGKFYNFDSYLITLEMENNLSPRLLSDLEEFRQQALRCVNDATFALNNLRGKSFSFIYYNNIIKLLNYINI